jgi:hypothetical protein
LIPWSGCEEGRDGRVARGVVEEEPALPGQHRDGVTVDLHGKSPDQKFLMRARRVLESVMNVVCKRRKLPIRCKEGWGRCRNRDEAPEGRSDGDSR